MQYSTKGLSLKLKDCSPVFFFAFMFLFPVPEPLSLRLTSHVTGACDTVRTFPFVAWWGLLIVNWAMSLLLETSLGDIVIDLEVEACPKTCENFLKLCKVYYYNLNAFFNGPLSVHFLTARFV